MHGTPSDLVPWIDWGGSGPQVHFAHANGFPPETYSQLIQPLTGALHVESMAARPLWGQPPQQPLRNWFDFAEDLRTTLEDRGRRGIIGVGHSLGAVTSLLASADDHGLFTAVIAIDPLVLTGSHSVVWGLMKRFGLADRLPLVRGAVRRRNHWPDRRTIRETYSKRPAFEDWDAAVLEDYLQYGFVDHAEGGLELRYPKTWEAAIFRAAPHNLWPTLRRIRVPVLFVQGAHSDTFTDAARRRVIRELPNAQVAVVGDAGHFVPMEKPAEVSRVILEFLDSL